MAADAHRGRAVSDLHWLTAVEAARAIAARELSPVELLAALLERIGRLDPKLQAFIRLDGEAAMDAARAAEVEIMSGRRRGPLHGVPVGIKDIIDVAGLPTTCFTLLILIDHIAARMRACRGCAAPAPSLWVFSSTPRIREIGGPSFDLPWAAGAQPVELDHHPGGSSSIGAGIAPASSRWRWARHRR